MKYLSPVIVVLTLLVSACKPAALPQNATQTIVASSTQAPDTPTLPPTPRLATATPTSTPDFEATQAGIGNAVMSAIPPRLYESYPSPDGQWRVEIIIYDCVQLAGGGDSNAYEELRLIEVSTGETKVVDSQLLNCGGLGAFGLEGRLWSPNSRYFYYTDARESWPDGGCGYWERPLLRFDVTKEGTESLGMGPFSPDRTKLATWQYEDIVVWGLDEGGLSRPDRLVSGWRVAGLSADGGGL